MTLSDALAGAGRLGLRGSTPERIGGATLVAPPRDAAQAKRGRREFAVTLDAIHAGALCGLFLAGVVIGVVLALALVVLARRAGDSAAPPCGRWASTGSP